MLEHGKRGANDRQGSDRVVVRVSLTGRISIEAGGIAVDERRLPGRQGRLAFAYLVAADGRPVPTGELAEAIWIGEPPPSWEKSLSVLVSKLRALLNECGVEGATSLTGAFGCYQLTLPEGAWVDLAAADSAASTAERALAIDDLDVARANASTAESLARKTFLPGEEGRWVEEVRARLREVLVRALDCLADVNRLSGDLPAAVRAAEELIAREPFRERGYRLLMQAQSAAGNDAEALRTYERCRTLLAEELGAYPSAETEAVYLEILRSSPRGSTADVNHVDLDGPTPAPPAPAGERRERDRRKLAALAAALVAAGVATAAAVALTRGGEAPVTVLPNSVVRIDPNTNKPTQVVRVGREPDLVVIAGGFVWVTHRGRRYTDTDALRNSGDRTLTRIDPSTGEAVVVGGGLAPCGLTADPSGDVWVANCFASRAGVGANVVRIDARTLNFEATWPVPAGIGYFRGLVYGGGSLWVADVSGSVDYHGVTRLDPRTGAQRRIEFDRHAGWLSWSEGYGDLWMNDFDRGSVSRMHAATGVVETFDSVAVNPGPHAVEGDAVWVADWANPQVVRLPAVGSREPRSVSLPTGVAHAGVTTLAADAGWVWAAVPTSHAVWRIDAKTNEVTPIAMRHFPWGIAAAGDEIWVAVRAKPA
jgi:SARP family transcriptional regulator, regulator of embCAB operon